MHPRTRPQWGNSSPWWFRAACNAHFLFHVQALQNPHVVTDTRHRLLHHTCEFNRGKFGWNRSIPPVDFHEWQHRHVDSLSKLAKLRFSKRMPHGAGHSQAWQAQVPAWKQLFSEGGEPLRASYRNEKPSVYQELSQDMMSAKSRAPACPRAGGQRVPMRSVR